MDSSTAPYWIPSISYDFPLSQTLQREKENVSGGCRSIHSTNGHVISDFVISNSRGAIEIFNVPVKRKAN
jgi:hypothetical protein